MSLADYTPERQDVSLGKTVASVRGLSLTDLAKLIKTHLSDIDHLFGMFENATQGDKVEAQKLAAELAREAPGLVANLIAMACDEPEQADKAHLIAFPVQINLLMAIGTLTFQETGGVKKSLETLGSLLGLLKPQAVFQNPPA